MIPNLGVKFVAGSADDGTVMLTREDGTVDSLPFLIIFQGTITDNNDGTVDVDFGLGS